MYKIRKLNGVIPVVQSFFNSKGEIDENSTRKHINFLVKNKVGGLWVLGTGSEDMNISFNKRLEIAKIISSENSYRVPLILGCSFFCYEEIIEFIDQTGKLEFDAYHFMPYHPLLSLERLSYLYEKIVDHSMKKFQKPLWIYSSANWSKKINYDFIKKLSKKRGICGIKYSTSNAPDQIKVIELDSSGFQVVTAVIRQFISNLAGGVRASTTSVAGAIPEPVNLIYQEFQKGNLKKALKYQRILNQFLNSMPKKIKIDNFLTASEEKIILKLRGIGNGKVSDYYRDCSKSEIVEIELAVKKLYKNLNLTKKLII